MLVLQYFVGPGASWCKHYVVEQYLSSINCRNQRLLWKFSRIVFGGQLGDCVILSNLYSIITSLSGFTLFFHKNTYSVQNKGVFEPTVWLICFWLVYKGHKVKCLVLGNGKFSQPKPAMTYINRFEILSPFTLSHCLRWTSQWSLVKEGFPS